MFCCFYGRLFFPHTITNDIIYYILYIIYYILYYILYILCTLEYIGTYRCLCNNNQWKRGQIFEREQGMVFGRFGDRKEKGKLMQLYYNLKTHLIGLLSYMFPVWHSHDFVISGTVI